ncbi:Calmodulin-lysine N-methyltransferase [Balamuthia mandrillaris]
MRAPAATAVPLLSGSAPAADVRQVDAAPSASDTNVHDERAAASWVPMETWLLSLRKKYRAGLTPVATAVFAPFAGKQLRLSLVAEKQDSDELAAVREMVMEHKRRREEAAKEEGNEKEERAKVTGGSCEDREELTFAPTEVEMQLALLQFVIQDQVCQRFPLSIDYSKRFLKHYIAAVEADPQNELCEELLEHYLSLMQLPPSSCDASSEQPLSYKTYEMVCNHTTTNDERRQQQQRETISFGVSQQFNLLGMVTWDAGFFLAEYILANTEQFAGKRCLELGAGLGITGVTLCKTGAPKQVVLTDYTDEVINNLTANVRNNGILVTPFRGMPPCDDENEQHKDEKVGECEVNVLELDWFRVTKASLSSFSPDIILAADVVSIFFSCLSVAYSLLSPAFAFAFAFLLHLIFFSLHVLLPFFVSFCPPLPSLSTGV